MHDRCRTPVGIIFPKTRGLTFRVTPDTGGKLSIATDNDFGNTTTFRIGRVSAEMTGLSEKRSVVAYEAGGIHVKSGSDTPAWTTPVLMQISPIVPTAARIEIVIISFGKEAEISGSGHLPVTLTLRGSAKRTLYWRDNATIRFQSPDAEQKLLWETVLFETKEQVADGSNVIITQSDPITLRLETTTNTTPSELLLREALYDTGPAEIIYA